MFEIPLIAKSRVHQDSLGWPKRLVDHGHFNWENQSILPRFRSGHAQLTNFGKQFQDSTAILDLVPQKQCSNAAILCVF